jgi:hypothetical protein
MQPPFTIFIHRGEGVVKQERATFNKSFIVKTFAIHRVVKATTFSELYAKLGEETH